MDLEERCHTSVEESAYEHIHTSGKPVTSSLTLSNDHLIMLCLGSLRDEPINMTLLLAAFINSRLVADEGYAEVTPYFEGYCGSPKMRRLNTASRCLITDNATVGPVRRKSSRNRYSGRNLIINALLWFIYTKHYSSIYLAST